MAISNENTSHADMPSSDDSTNPSDDVRST
jgi:hypothetical protein